MQTGGVMINKGAYGCVFTPPLYCKDEDAMDVPAAEGQVSKIMDLEEATLEWKLTSAVRDLPLYKNYFIVSEKMCQPAKRKRQTEEELKLCPMLKHEHLGNFRLLRMQYGGIPLLNYKMSVYRKGFLKFVIHLLEGASILVINGLVHRDLHKGNILVDDVGVPRIIDFNLALNMKEPIVKADMTHMVRYEILQETPDSALVNAIDDGKKSDTTIEKIIDSKIFKKIESGLGISIDEMREEMFQFYENSKSTQSGDVIKWIHIYWHVQDSWAIGVIILTMLMNMSLWRKFADGSHKEYDDNMLEILRGMLHVNPQKRMTCIRALSILNPESEILELEKAKSFLVADGVRNVAVARYSSWKRQSHF